MRRIVAIAGFLVGLVSLNGCGDPLVGGLVCAEASGEALCDGACANLTGDDLNCGACGNVCPGEEICTDSMCALPCVGTEVQCGNLCAPLETDRTNCGACGTLCALGEVCSEGMCGLECGGSTPIRCDESCVDTDNNAEHCGGCDIACADGEVCSGGACGLSCGGATPTLCAESCVDTMNDRGNCGTCGVVCPSGEVCSDGVCGLSCGGATPALCGLSCVDTDTNRNHCGGCDVLCPEGEVCSEGTCGLSCGGDTGTQCGTRCVDTDTHREHCGACDAGCGAGEICADGVCGLNCGGTTPTLCGLSCVDTETNRVHCGACDATCEAGEVCSEGVCSLTCGGTTPTQCGLSCTNTERDPDNCGACDTECASGESCVAGVCELSCGAATPDICDGACTDVDTNRDHCGACGNSCAPGEVCNGGTCALGCGGATPELCGSSCVDPDSNRQHCGACDNRCAVGEVCAAGACTLSCGGTTPTQCGTSCTDTNTDESNCGVCGTRCASGESCVAGTCEISCGASAPTVCDSTCVDTDSNRAHCGACGNACGAGQVCSGAACVASCGAGLADCSGSCVDTDADPANCGACGVTCESAPGSAGVCVAGACQYFCAPTFGDCNADLGAPGGDGCETSLVGTAANCGACGSTCGIGDVCRGGACVQTTSTTMGTDFGGAGAVGASFDPAEGGLVLDASATVNDFLWIPNTGESSMSKWDPVTNTEVARYRVGLASGECVGSCCHSNGCNMPSRVVVDGSGDAYVANRGFGMQGTVTKIAANIDDCVDRNGNGMIDTSTSSTAMAYGADECILFHAPVGASNALLRAIAIDAGDAAHPEGYPWVGGYNSRQFWKLDPDTGAVIDGPIGVSFAPYGAVVLGDGTLYASGLSTTTLAVIDTTVAAPTATTITVPRPPGAPDWLHYGMTADANGRLWFSNGRGIQGYDPATNLSTASPIAAGGDRLFSGVTVDGVGRVWTAINSNPMQLMYWDADDFVPNGLIPLSETTTLTMPAGYTQASAVGADSNNIIWFTNSGSPTALFRVDPDTGVVTTSTGLNRVYSYSDFTGGVRRTVIATGTYDETFDGLCTNPVWDSVVHDIDTPAGTSVEFVGRTADTIAGLNAATAVTVTTTPPDVSPGDITTAFMAAGVTPERYFRLTTIIRGIPGESPVVRSYTVGWTCP